MKYLLLIPLLFVIGCGSRKTHEQVTSTKDTLPTGYYVSGMPVHDGGYIDVQPDSIITDSGMILVTDGNGHMADGFSGPIAPITTTPTLTLTTILEPLHWYDKEKYETTLDSPLVLQKILIREFGSPKLMK